MRSTSLRLFVCHILFTRIYFEDVRELVVFFGLLQVFQLFVELAEFLLLFLFKVEQRIQADSKPFSEASVHTEPGLNAIEHVGGNTCDVIFVLEVLGFSVCGSSAPVVVVNREVEEDVSLEAELKSEFGEGFV